jgi:hypothetical protein
MPNWIYNKIVITGDAETLQQFFFANFDLEKLLEDPNAGVRTANQPDVMFDDDGSLRIYFESAYGPLHTQLWQLSTKYTGIRIVNDFCEGMNFMVGHTVYENGDASGGYMCSADYSASALRAFSKENPWLDAEREIRAKEDRGCPPDMLEEGESTVVLTVC